MKYLGFGFKIKKLGIWVAFLMILVRNMNSFGLNGLYRDDSHGDMKILLLVYSSRVKLFQVTLTAIVVMLISGQ